MATFSVFNRNAGSDLVKNWASVMNQEYNATEKSVDYAAAKAKLEQGFNQVESTVKRFTDSQATNSPEKRKINNDVLNIFEKLSTVVQESFEVPSNTEVHKHSDSVQEDVQTVSTNRFALGR